MKIFWGGGNSVSQYAATDSLDDFSSSYSFSKIPPDLLVELDAEHLQIYFWSQLKYSWLKQSEAIQRIYRQTSRLKWKGVTVQLIYIKLLTLKFAYFCKVAIYIQMSHVLSVVTLNLQTILLCLEYNFVRHLLEAT